MSSLHLSEIFPASMALEVLRSLRVGDMRIECIRAICWLAHVEENGNASNFENLYRDIRSWVRHCTRTRKPRPVLVVYAPGLNRISAINLAAIGASVIASRIGQQDMSSEGATPSFRFSQILFQLFDENGLLSSEFPESQKDGRFVYLFDAEKCSNEDFQARDMNDLVSDSLRYSDHLQRGSEHAYEGLVESFI